MQELLPWKMEGTTMNVELNETCQKKLKAFEQAIIEGEQSGPLTAWNIEEVIQGAMKKIKAT